MPQNYSQSIPLTINTLSTDEQALDTEYIVLSNIYISAENQFPLRQRELAQIAGASLGMTNSILKRLAQKGWITIKKLNSRNIQYAVTLEGLNEIVHRSYRYFKRTIRNVVFFKDILDNVVLQAKNRNVHTAILVGSSDLDFIIEHACNRWNLNFINVSATEKAEESPAPGTLILYAEDITEEDVRTKAFAASDSAAGDVFHLSQLIMKQASAPISNDLET